MPRLLRRKRTGEGTEVGARVPTRDEWHELLHREDRRCEEAGFGAGIVSIDFGASAGQMPAPQRTQQVLELVERTIAWTDRFCLVAPNVASILVIPITEIHQLERLARRLDGVCRDAGVQAAIGWSHRRDSSDLVAAWARADANAAVAHARHVRLVG
ncbi:MAG: hypothetical protein OES57_18560 [Acidimicrobiia bacterium]|nr:hypothetical protein [Acidimicrobiia bacterium]